MYKRQGVAEAALYGFPGSVEVYALAVYEDLAGDTAGKAEYTLQGFAAPRAHETRDAEYLSAAQAEGCLLYTSRCV